MADLWAGMWEVHLAGWKDQRWVEKMVAAMVRSMVLQTAADWANQMVDWMAELMGCDWAVQMESLSAARRVDWRAHRMVE